MRALPWILVGVGIGAVITAVFFSEPEAEYATGYDSVEGAARKTFGWGTTTRAEGTLQSVKGAVKEGFGRIIGDDEIAGEGSAERAVGDIKDAAGTLGHAVGQTIHDLNR
jgi:uncharacterized protein YjbJ (UPF0337 family)